MEDEQIHIKEGIEKNEEWSSGEKPNFHFKLLERIGTNKK